MCEKLEAKVASLEKELNQVNKSLKIYLILDIILNTQKPRSKCRSNEQSTVDNPSHNFPRFQKSMLTSFAIIQNRRSCLIQENYPFTALQRMKKSLLLKKNLHQEKTTQTCNKLSFLAFVSIVKILVTKLSIARLINMIVQEDIGPIIKISWLIQGNQVKSRTIIHLILCQNIV